VAHALTASVIATQSTRIVGTTDNDLEMEKNSFIFT